MRINIAAIFFLLAFCSPKLSLGETCFPTVRPADTLKVGYRIKCKCSPKTYRFDGKKWRLKAWFGIGDSVEIINGETYHPFLFSFGKEFWTGRVRLEKEGVYFLVDEPEKFIGPGYPPLSEPQLLFSFQDTSTHYEIYGAGLLMGYKIKMKGILKNESGDNLYHYKLSRLEYSKSSHSYIMTELYFAPENGKIIFRIKPPFGDEILTCGTIKGDWK